MRHKSGGWGIRFVALVCGALAASGVHAQRLDRPDWRVGDSWRYRATSTPEARPGTVAVRMNRQTILSVASDRIETSSEDEENGRTIRTIWTWNANGEVLSRARDGEPVHLYRPPIRFSRWPGEPGQHWRFTFGAETEAGRPLYGMDIEVRVVAWETVTVPAGTFLALKSEVSSFSPDGTCTGAGAFWFAPQVKRRIRFEERTYSHGRLAGTIVHELLSFTPGPASP